MIRSPVVTGQFRKDLKRLRRQRKDLARLRETMGALVKGQALPSELRDHKLQGQWRGRRECHIEPDWLLIYLIKPEEIVFERTGSHADLFE